MSQRNPAKYIQIAGEVTRLREKEHMSFLAIARKLKIHVGTVTRAYDHGHRSDVTTAAEAGKKLDHGLKSGLSPAVHARICKEFKAGRKPGEIAKIVGCGISTVIRERRLLHRETGA